jgi:hypothetical protein
MVERSRLIGQLQLLKKPRFGRVFAFRVLQAGLVQHRTNDINSHICDIKHISLFLSPQYRS